MPSDPSWEPLSSVIPAKKKKNMSYQVQQASVNKCEIKDSPSQGIW